MNWLLVPVFMAAVSLCPMSAWQRWLCLPGACRCGLCPANWSNYSTNICSLDLIFNKPSRYFYFLAVHPHKSAVPCLNSGEQRAVLTRGESGYSFSSFFTILHIFSDLEVYFLVLDPAAALQLHYQHFHFLLAERKKHFVLIALIQLTLLLLD